MKKQLISFSLIAAGFLIGASALSAMAQSTWTAPQSAPPGGNVTPPVLTGSLTSPMGLQTVFGPLQLNGNFGLAGNFLYNPGGTITKGEVLTANDTGGTVVWGQGGGGSDVPQGIVAFTSSGSWPAPAGITRALVQVWGGGGGGGAYNVSTGKTGGGGGGGGYSEATVPITAGLNYTVTVGGGGPNGTNSGTTCGSAGGTSSFAAQGGTIYLSATGGAGGHSSCDDGDSYYGGAGGTPGSIGSPATGFGMSGGDGSAGANGAWQSPGGNSPMAAGGSVAFYQSTPKSPGGGGGSGISVSGEEPGWTGAGGMVVVEY